MCLRTTDLRGFGYGYSLPLYFRITDLRGFGYGYSLPLYFRITDLRGLGYGYSLPLYFRTTDLKELVMATRRLYVTQLYPLQSQTRGSEGNLHLSTWGKISQRKRWQSIYLYFLKDITEEGMLPTTSRRQMRVLLNRMMCVSNLVASVRFFLYVD
ncbi:hypothetical protein Btru_016461 [Bulinus truncatus]|nr:hypothetical protein Btru_016461 [Bulinus truncatus]